jgi:nitronate monooxygenase
MARLKTRLTEFFHIEHPILSAPMALAAGGALAAAVTRAGGLGLIGGGYGDGQWLEQQFDAAGNTAVGCGFITWSMARNPALLTQVLRRKPKALMLSFGDPQPHAAEIAAADVPLICQCQTVAHVREALAAGATAIVAQGAEAGGHGQSRGTLNFVPEVADLLKRDSPQTLLIAAGGIGDGRGLAAALMLGADGVLMGTRLWATREALVHANHHAAILASDGDATARTRAPDIARQLDWPAQFTVRVANNAFVRAWDGREAELRTRVDIEAPKYRAAFAAGDAENAGVFFGEAAGLIDDIPDAASMVARTVGQAVDVMRSRQSLITA